MNIAMQIRPEPSPARRPFRSRAKRTPEERSAIARAHLQQARAVQAAKRAQGLSTRRPPIASVEPELLTPAQQLYRAEKAAKLTRTAALMTVARAELNAAMAAQAEQRKKGPRFGGRIEVRRDPADALIVALEGGR